MKTKVKKMYVGLISKESHSSKPLNLTLTLAVDITEAKRRKAEEELVRTRTSRKRKAEEELVPPRTRRKRKAEEELVPTSTRRKRKAEEQVKTQNKRSCLESNDLKVKKALKILKARRSLCKVQTEESQSFGTSYPAPMSLNWSDSAFFNFTPPSSSSEPRISFDNPFKVHRNKKEFKAKYCQLNMLGKGSFGYVFAGKRLSDSKPVAIKHIPKSMVEYMWVKCQGNCYKEVAEVVFMALAAGLLSNDNEANRAIIGLLDVYVLREEVLIVMEQPLEAMNVIQFLDLREGQIPEHEAKIIFKQLVHAAVLMHRNGILHRDIKGENILVSLHKGTLSIRIIDFGCSDVVQEKLYSSYAGTLSYAPPELFLQRQYNAEPTTVWQIGAMLRHLYNKGMFHIRDYMRGPNLPFEHLSHECNNFMDQCLSINPKQRPGLEELQHHPWLE